MREKPHRSSLHPREPVPAFEPQIGPQDDAPRPPRRPELAGADNKTRPGIDVTRNATRVSRR